MTKGFKKILQLPISVLWRRPEPDHDRAKVWGHLDGRDIEAGDAARGQLHRAHDVHF